MIRDSLSRNLHLWNHHRISYKSKSPVFPWSSPAPLVLHPQSCHLPKAMGTPNKWTSASNHQQRLSCFWMLHLWDLWFNFVPPTPCFLRHYCLGIFIIRAWSKELAMLIQNVFLELSPFLQTDQLNRDLCQDPTEEILWYLEWSSVGNSLTHHFLPGVSEYRV